MDQPKLQISIEYRRQKLPLEAVKVNNSFLIYKEGKPYVAVTKDKGNWEEIFSGPTSPVIIQKIGAELDKLSNHQ